MHTASYKRVSQDDVTCGTGNTVNSIVTALHSDRWLLAFLY